MTPRGRCALSFAAWVVGCLVFNVQVCEGRVGAAIAVGFILCVHGARLIDDIDTVK